MTLWVIASMISISRNLSYETFDYQWGGAFVVPAPRGWKERQSIIVCQWKLIDGRALEIIANAGFAKTGFANTGFANTCFVKTKYNLFNLL